MRERSHLINKFGQIYLFVFAHLIIAGASAQRRAPPSPVARLTEGTLQGKKKLKIGVGLCPTPLSENLAQKMVGTSVRPSVILLLHNSQSYVAT